MSRVLLTLSIVLFAFTLKAQTKAAPGPAERKLIDSLCVELGKIDIDKITTKEQADNVFNDAFAKFAGMLMDVAEERKIDINDSEGMQAVGTEIGKNLLKAKCSAFLKVAAKMNSTDKTDKEDTNIGTTQGVLKRIENKGFNYLVVTDAANREKSFLWLRQFQGSERLTGLPATYAGKKVKIKWQEIEVYLPQAKGYYKVKEIVGIDVM